MARNGRSSAGLSPETRESLIILLILALAGLSIFSLLDFGGPFGLFWKDILVAFFGWGTWYFPLLLIVIVTLKVRGHARAPLVLSGLILFVLSTLALAGLKASTSSQIPNAPPVIGGGYVGLLLQYPLEHLFGFQAAVFVSVLIVLASLLVIFDTTIPTVSSIFAEWIRRPVGFFSGFLDGFRNAPSRPVRESDEEDEAPMSFFSRRKMRTAEPPELDEESEQESLPMDGVAEPVARAPKYKPVAIDLPLDLLKKSTDKPTSGDIREQKLQIQRTLESFGIAVEMGEVAVGPTVTQYTLKPEEGVKLAAITGLHNDLALALAAHPIRIEAPIPGKSLVGIEVPNRAVATVQLRDILESEEFQKRRSNLHLGVGKDVSGAPWAIDLERLPHLLVAGATGSGKSVCLNTIIVSLLYQNNPSDLRFILVDPKRVEFSVYQHMPHLLTPVITEVPATVNALKWLLREMDRRFTLLQGTGDRNIQSYNKHAEEKLPFIVLMIDELADLMVAAASEVEGSIIRLAQMARAVGIHLILATQRPSVDVITGLIKANIIARVAFSVASLTDSRTILDAGGAEKLVGRGDLLYVSAEVTKPKRLQGAFLSDEEIRNIVDFLKNKAAPDYVPDVTEKQKSGPGSFASGDDGDDMYGEAEALVVETGKASASFLQRRLKVGYARAARLLDLLEANGVIGPGDGAKPRDVLIASIDRDIVVEEDTEEEVEGEPKEEEYT